jgi:tetratricopeptide (TPR) repeat protein
VSNDNIGYVLLNEGRLDEALASYKEGFAIRQKLANSGKANATWQRDLAVSDDNIAAVLVNEGKLNEALASYMEGLAIRQMLTEKDKTNTEWQRDLSVIHDNIGYKAMIHTSRRDRKAKAIAENSSRCRLTPSVTKIQ